MQHVTSVILISEDDCETTITVRCVKPSSVRRGYTGHDTK